MGKVNPEDGTIQTQYLHRGSRGLVIIGVLVFLIIGLWTIYWFWMSQILANSINEWIIEHNQRGLQIRNVNPNISGYPFWFDIRFESAAVVARREEAWAWHPPPITASARPWQRSKLFLDLSGEHQFKGARRIKFFARKLNAVIRIEERGSWRTEFDGKDLMVDVSRMGDLSVKKIAVKVNWRGDIEMQEAPAFRMNLDLNSLKVPGAWALPLGNEFRNLYLAADLEVSPMNLYTLDGIRQWRENGGILDLTRINVGHGPLKIDGDGTFALDGDLQPLAALMLRIEGAMETVDMLLKRDVIGIGQAVGIKLMLAALTDRSAGKSGRIKVPLSLQNQELSAQSFNLIRIPRIDWSLVFN